MPAALRLASGVTFLMPLPGAGHDLIELRELRLPSQLMLDLLRAGDEYGRITGTTLALFDGDLAAGDTARGVDNLPNREALATSKVVDQPTVVLESVEGEEVSLGEIADVN